MVVVTTCRVGGRINVVAGAIVYVVRGRVRGEGLGAIAHGDDGIVGPDGCNHFATAGEVVHVGSVFVGDPESAIVIENEAFAVEWDALTEDSEVTPAEAVAGVRGDGQVGEAWIREMAASIRIKTGAWSAIWAIEQDGFEICENEVGTRGIGYSGIRLWGEVDIELVDSWLHIKSPFRIPELRVS